jgi:hypothetical protein
LKKDVDLRRRLLDTFFDRDGHAFEQFAKLKLFLLDIDYVINNNRTNA